MFKIGVVLFNLYKIRENNEHRPHADEASMPANVQELERQVGVRLVVADRTDPEEVGYVQWRTAFYVAGRC